MTQADVVFDIASNDWEYAPSLPEILASGTRVLQILLPRSSVIERAPDPENSWRADASELLMKDAKQIRVTTPEGTDLRATLAEDRPLDVARGFVREPGEWDSYGTDLIAAAPIEGSVHGTIVFNGPLILFPQFTFSPRAPIRVEVAEGRITGMAVEDEDGRKLEWWFAQWDDPNAYVFSHIGWGLDPRANLSVPELTAWESYDGGVMVAFGSNTGGKLRGEVRSQAHMDGILLGASLWLDDLQIIQGGVFTEASGLRARSPDTRPTR
jgi:2,5-dihydroxypyridine 5,6-dioxygenase